MPLKIRIAIPVPISGYRQLERVGSDLSMELPAFEIQDTHRIKHCLYFSDEVLLRRFPLLMHEVDATDHFGNL